MSTSMKIGYYPGCSAKGSSLDYELSSNEVCRILGIVSSEIDQWNCCGSTPAHAVSTELSAALCTRNLVQATKQGADVVMTPCPSCLSNLLHAKERMKNPDFKKRVDELLDEPSPESLPEATSVMQMIGKLCSAEDIKKHVRMSLAGIRIAPYYGCLMSRPADLMNFGDPENPTLMEELLTACGADSIIDFPLKTECCGASAGIPHRPLTSVNSGRILDVATKMEADCIVVCCPLCQMNLDLRQKQAERQANARFRIPVLYYTQLMGLAFGCDPKTLGLGKLIVSADRIVDRIQALNTARMEATGGAA
ncbi:CoB--CoM heterodisulfide reductase iron-sulfur subunit B family protein [Desulfovibrio sp. An276]|uniref:CoB--CoM heterodisulfide reductase iron-sulfur subunit B family protein n=1 Tax=Desulfovibrio sp. An276 TaxID=1965618 RepID=UPI001EF6B2EA|nr:CoB--CoM heterodisulfide reductase iron-sulfur subunit B family protein [Desulfovibrio sp. An276]